MKLVALTAPSGSGKTTIAHRVRTALPELQFSVSATTRMPRVHEVHGEDYYFLNQEHFMKEVRAGGFVEYEEVYPGLFYGTLISEIERLGQRGPVLLDIDVQGAANVKKLYEQNAFVVFIQPPSLEVLHERLSKRGTESASSLATRLDKAEHELSFAPQFDAVVVNDDLDRATEETLRLIRSFVSDCN